MNPALLRDVETAVLSTLTFALVQEDMHITVRSIDQSTLMPGCAGHACRERLKRSVPLDLA